MMRTMIEVDTYFLFKKCSERLRKVQTNEKGFLGFFQAMFESPDKIGLGEQKKSPHKDPFSQNIPFRGLLSLLTGSDSGLILPSFCRTTGL